MVYINGKRDGYAEDQCEGTMTVRQLIDYLESNFDEDDKVYLMNDGGYIYGSITESDISEEKEKLGYRY